MLVRGSTWKLGPDHFSNGEQGKLNAITCWWGAEYYQNPDQLSGSPSHYPSSIDFRGSFSSISVFVEPAESKAAEGETLIDCGLLGNKVRTQRWSGNKQTEMVLLTSRDWCWIGGQKEQWWKSSKHSQYEDRHTWLASAKLRKSQERRLTSKSIIHIDFPNSESAETPGRLPVTTIASLKSLINPNSSLEVLQVQTTSFKEHLEIGMPFMSSQPHLAL